MTRRKTTKKATVKSVTKQLRKSTPFADAGNIVGKKLGSMFNVPQMQGIGKWLGSGIGQIFGSGDYTMSGPSPSYNVLVNSAQIPKFSTTKQTNIVCHREYIGDVSSTTTWNNTPFALNPGVSTTFPWLSTVAQSYQQYKFHGLIFEFKPMITDFAQSGAPGVIVMATNYNADNPPYNSKQEMENSEFAVATKPTLNMIHGVECALDQTVLSQLYVRSGVPDAHLDLKTYDIGTFQFATTSATTTGQTIGELWVSYCVEFYKPLLPEDTGGDIRSVHLYRSGVTNASPLGTVQVIRSGDLDLLASNSTTASWNAHSGNRYLVNISWIGSVDAVIAYPIPTATLGAVLKQYWINDTVTFVVAPNNGATARQIQMTFILEATSTSVSTQCGFTLGTAGTLPTGTPTVDVTITQMDSSISM